MRVARLALVSLGVALGLVGVYAFVTAVDVSQWIGAGVWLAAGVVAHDALLAPAALLLGVVLLPRVPARFRGPARGVLLALAVGVMVSVPLLATGGLRT
jgi:hypothetical protein